MVLNYVWGLVASQSRSNLISYAIDGVSTNVPRSGSGTLTLPTITMNTYHSVSDAGVTQYRLTVSTSPETLTPQPTITIDSGYTTGDGYYDTSSVVSIDPSSPAGYTFDHWNRDASGSAVPLSVTMNFAKTIVAVFRFNLAVESGFKAGDSPSFASDPYLNEIMCVLVEATSTSYKLAGTSPGTFDYAIAIRNTGPTTFTSITITVTWNSDYFTLQSSNPIRVLDATGADISAQFTKSVVGSKITISSTTYQLPAYASLYVTIHLDYKLKGETFPSQFYNRAYTFTTTVTGTSGPNSGSKDAYGSVVFLSKKATIIYGFVKTSSGAPIAGARIELWKPGASSPTYVDHTDSDGFYCFIDGVEDENDITVSPSGGVTYTVKCNLLGATDPFAFQPVTAQSLKAVTVNFTKLE